MSYSKKFLPKFLISFFFLAIIVVGISWNKLPEVKAGTTVPVTGYAWSDIIGWINFNPAFGGVFYDNTVGQLSGYAWSNNIGWVYFGPDKSNISASTAPNDPKQWAKTNLATGIVNGWAKTYRAILDKTDANAEDGQTLGGWEGWIKMDHGMSNPVSIDFATGDFHGWAWSSDTAGIIGWISFNSKDCDLDNNGFMDIACGGKNNNTTPAYPYKVTIGSNNAPTYTIEPATASASVGGAQRFIGYYDSDGSGVAVKIDKTLEASYWEPKTGLIATIATSTGQAIATCSTAGTVAITSSYNNIPASAGLECTTGGIIPVCGNSKVELGEQCDDGNIISGDGCSATCQTEGGCGGNCGGGYCGDGTINSGEQCDDGAKNGTGQSQCTNSCQNTTCGGCGGNSVYEIVPKDPTVDVGKGLQFDGILTYANGFKETKTKEASWESTNASIPINNTDKKGVAFCNAEGSATIKSTYGTKSAQTSLTCKKGDSGTITITPNTSTIKAVIIEGLPANSETATLNITSSCGNVTLSPRYTGLTTGGSFSFSANPVEINDSTKTGITKFSVKNIPGNTEAKTYPIEITGTGISCSGKTTVNLKVERVGSIWEEF